jgi:small-conductance mechanosensitive channel
MRKTGLLFTLFLSFLFLPHLLVAQSDTTKKHTDSLNTILLSEYNKKISEIEKQRQSDSLRRANLEAQLMRLKTTDNLKKEELQSKLESLNDKEKFRLAEKKLRIDALRSTAKSFPVMGMFNDTLFAIYSNHGSFSARERANVITNRIAKLSDQFGFKADSIKVIESETTTDLVMGDNILMSISENDAIWNNATKTELAKTYKKIIGDAITNFQKETSLETLAKKIGLALLVLVFMGVLIFYIFKLFNWSEALIRQNKGDKFKGFNIKNYTLLDTQKQINVFVSINSFLKWIIILLFIYLALPILFGFFPWTKNFAETLIGYIINPLKKMGRGVWAYLPNLFTVLTVVFVFRYILKGVFYLKTEIQRGNLKISGFYPDWANPTYQILKVLLYAFMFVLIFPYLPGSNSPIFQGVSVFLGVLFTFGSSGSLSNIIAGLVLTYMRLFKIGDRVKIGDVTGDIIEKSLLVTRIRTTKNEIISIPNSTVMSSHTINYSSDTVDNGLILHTTITLGYDVPWKKVHQTLIDAAGRTEFLLKTPTPFVLQTSLDDFYVSYQINAYTKEANKQAKIYSDLHANIQDCCNENDIEILSPHYRASRDGNMSTIPAQYLPKDYEAPSFNLNIKKD